LRLLEGPDCNVFEWERKEAEWALENWPRLENLIGFFMDDDAYKLLERFL
jgi:hypothetical protein